MLNLTQKWGQPVVRPAVASADLVEVGIVVAPGRGTVLPLINWQMTPETDLELRLDNASGWCATHIYGWRRCADVRLAVAQAADV